MVLRERRHRPPPQGHGLRAGPPPPAPALLTATPHFAEATRRQGTDPADGRGVEQEKGRGGLWPTAGLGRCVEQEKGEGCAGDCSEREWVVCGAGGARPQHLLSRPPSPPPPLPLPLSLSQEVYALNTYSVENVPAVVAVALKRFDQSLNKASRLPLVSI